MTDAIKRTEPDEARLRQALHVAAELPAPPDLPRRVLDRPQFKGARTARSGRRTAPPVRRTWAVAGAAASVAAVVLGVAVFGGTAQRTGPIDSAVGGAQPATAATAGTSVAAGPTPETPSGKTTTAGSPVLLPPGNYRA